jgi:hypothetical protein
MAKPRPRNASLTPNLPCFGSKRASAFTEIDVVGGGNLVGLGASSGEGTSANGSASANPGHKERSNAPKKAILPIDPDDPKLLRIRASYEGRIKAQVAGANLLENKSKSHCSPKAAALTTKPQTKKYLIRRATRPGAFR